jgi:hypothetical protein
MSSQRLSPTDLWLLKRVGQPEPHRDGLFAIVPVTTYDLEKPRNSIHWYGEFMNWLDRYLGNT